MKKLLLALSLFTCTTLMAQKKADTPLVKKPVSDSVVIKLSVGELKWIINWLDRTSNAPNMEKLQVEQLFLDRANNKR